MFLDNVYAATGGDPIGMVHLDQICGLLGIDRENSELAMRWLVDEQLIGYATHGPTLSVTHTGVRVVEEAREYRDRAVFPFPSYNEMFGDAEPDFQNVSGQQQRDLVRQGPETGVSSSGADRPGKPSLNSEPEDHDSEPRTANVAPDSLQDQIAIPLRTNPDTRAQHDKLGFSPYVDAVASFLLSAETEPPLTLSIEGDWGVGKSSFMIQLHERIQQEANSRNDAWKPLIMEFNPWRLSRDEELWASFAMRFKRGISGQLTRRERFKACMVLFTERMRKPESRLAISRAASIVAVFAIAVGGSLWALRYMGPGWIEAVASMNGSTGAAILKVLQVGGTAAIVLAAILLGMRLWPYVRRAFALDLRAYLSVPDYASRIPFAERFHQDFKAILQAYAARKRAFVFIDDLDRCAPPRAADLLRAISLLTSANQQLVFILGIDREKVAAGIAASYKSLLPYLVADGHPGASGDSTEACAGLEFGRKFVEKLVQLPFGVPAPGRQDLEAYVRHLGERQRAETNRRAPNASEDSLQPSQRTQEERLQGTHTVHLDPEDSPIIQRVTLMVSGVLGGNPRRVKQFLNLLRLRVYIGHATHMFEDSQMSRSWSVPQLGKLIALELLEPTLLSSLDRDPELLVRLEDVAVYGGQDSRDPSPDLAQWLSVRPRLGDLLRLGCVEDEWRDGFSKGQCSFKGLDLSRALRTAPRVRGFPVDRPQPRIVHKALRADVSVSGSVDAEAVHKGSSDVGHGLDSVDVERSVPSMNNSERADAKSERGSPQRIPIVGYSGSVSIARRVLPPRQRNNRWEIIALTPAEVADFEEVVGRYETEERAAEVFSDFQAWDLARLDSPLSQVRPFRFPPQ